MPNKKQPIFINFELIDLNNMAIDKRKSMPLEKAIKEFMEKGLYCPQKKRTGGKK